MALYQTQELASPTERAQRLGQVNQIGKFPTMEEIQVDMASKADNLHRDTLLVFVLYLLQLFLENESNRTG